MKFFKGIILLLCLITCKPVENIPSRDNPSPPKSPEQERASFQLQDPALKIELVASEPMVEDPVAAVFDEKGRMWVVEMRGFMNDINKGGEDQKIGRVSILEDTDADGKMDKSIIYADSLIMPRTIALVPNGALIAENNALWNYIDNNHDDKYDSKTLVDSQYARNGLPEHSENGMWRNLDNYYYNAKSTFRYRYEKERWIRDSTEFRGQWGICHDIEGKLIYNYNWSQLHGDLIPPNTIGRNKNHNPSTGIDYGYTLERRIYPIRPNPAVNRGYIPGTLDSNGRLLEFTSACSPFMYKENTLPPAYYQNVFVCEPAGNLVKRNKVEKNGLLVSAYDPNPGKEFLASTDERFRPVNFCTGPDGALYILDMYRGLIEHGPYVTPYLREQTLSRKLELPVHMGRIWRVTPKNWKAKKMKFSNDWVDLLYHQNAWFRDIAQKKIVESGDASFISKIKSKIESDSFSLGRLHALWSLHGLKHIDTTLLIRFIMANDPLLQQTALLHIETELKKYKTLETKVYNFIIQNIQRLHIQTALQVALSTYYFSDQNAMELALALLPYHVESPLMRDAILSGLQNKEARFFSQLISHPSWRKPSVGKEIFMELLSSAIIKNGHHEEIKNLLKFIDANSNWINNPSINGLFSMAGAKILKLNSKPSFFNKIDSSKLEKLSLVFDWPGNSKKTKNNNTVASLNSNDLKAWASGRQKYLNSCAGCHNADGKGINRFAPTLINSDWVTGDKRRLALLVLHGIEGPIEISGKIYDKPEILPVMPSHSTLTDNDIADILTYIRNEWGNSAGAMERRTVGMTRVLSQGRIQPWTALELNKYIQATDTTQKKSAQK